MELPDIGENCGVDTCKQLEFLPIKCEFCLKNFCKYHNLADNHNCPKKPPNQKGNEIVQQNKYCCSLLNCQNWELAPVSCPHCLKNFCLKHRHQVDHDCCEYIPPSNPLAEAAAKIQELTEHLASEPKKVKKVKNEKLAAKVQLMKLKGKAIGSKQFPAEERVFFSVYLPKRFSSKESNPVAVFVSYYWTVGRALDTIAEMAKVPNRNNETKAPRLNLFLANDGRILQPLDIPLKVLLDKDDICNGQTLILEYVDKSTELLEQFETYKK